MVMKTVTTVFENESYKYTNYYGQRANHRYNNKKSISLPILIDEKIYDEVLEYLTKEEFLKLKYMKMELGKSFYLSRISLLMIKIGEQWIPTYVMFQFRDAEWKTDYKRKRIKFKVN